MALNLKLVVATLAVTLTSASGEEESYELREMLASDRDKYMDSIGDRARIDNAGKAVGIKKFDGMQADLLTRCLFDKEGKKVPLVTIQNWPSSVVQSLFVEAQGLNHLNDKKEDASVKND